MTDPVALYCEPGRAIMEFRDLEMRQEFLKWVEDIQPTLREHNIQPSDPIQISLPPFSFKSGSTLARRMNRLNVDELDELAVDAVDVPDAVDVVDAPVDPVDPVRETVSVARSEDVDFVAASPEIVEDVYRHEDSIEQNFHRWAAANHAGESIVSFIPTGVKPLEKISTLFERHSARVEDLDDLRQYFVVVSQQTSKLDHTIRFLDGTVKTIDTDMLFTDDDAVEHTLTTLMQSETPMYFIEYLN